VTWRPGEQTCRRGTPGALLHRNATRFRKRQMADARSAVRLCAQARIVGVQFWDFKHGQTGVAPNAIELHPILGFRCLTTAKATLRPPGG
jgi:hypothetical protein